MQHHLMVVVAVAGPQLLGRLGCCLEQVQHHSELGSSMLAESSLCPDLPLLLVACWGRSTSGSVVIKKVEIIG